MADVFFSYKREDKNRVQPFFLELQRLGFQVAWDQKLLAGQEWEDWIFEQLIGARAVVVFWSHDSVTSDYVRREAHLAHNAKKLIPVFIDRLSPIERGRLFGFDGIHNIELINWKGDGENAAWLELLKAIERAITPAYVARMISQKNDELYQMRILRDTVIDREKKFEDRLVEAENARLEAMNCERRTGLALADATQKISDATTRTAQLEADLTGTRETLENTERRLVQEKGATQVLTQKLEESSARTHKLSSELDAEKGVVRRLTAWKRAQVLYAAAVCAVAIVLAGAVAEITASLKSHALRPCELLVSGPPAPGLSDAEAQEKFARCRSAMARWIGELRESITPSSITTGSTSTDSGGVAIGSWEARISDTLREEISRLGSTLVEEFPSLNRLNEDNKKLASLNESLRADVEALKKSKRSAPRLSENADNQSQQSQRVRPEPAVTAKLDACDRLAGDPFDAAQIAAGRPTRAVEELESDLDPAIRACEEAVKHSSEPRLRYQLGRAFMVGNNKRALEELEHARRSKYGAGMTLLGFIYREGQLVGEDAKKAKLYYEEAVALDEPAAMVQLAYMFRRKHYGMEDSRKAFELYRKAAAKKFPSAIMALGEFYRDGIVVTKDCNEATKYFAEAAGLGNQKAAEHLSKGCK